MLTTRRSALATVAFALPVAAAWPVRAQSKAPPPWPHTITMDQATVTVYQPQAISWAERKTLKARTAVAITRQDAANPILGTLDLTLTTEVNGATNTVTLTDPKLDGTRFPTLDTTQAAQIEGRIRSALATMPPKTVPMEAILLSLKQTEGSRQVAVDNTPPMIIYSQTPASLVVFDGEPVMNPIGTGGLSFAVNTNWPVFSDGGTWYLLNGTIWLAAPAYGGPYAPVTRLPASFAAIPNDQSFADVRKNIPPKPGQGAPPTVYVSTKPAEIIVTDGPPQLDPVPGTGLQVVKNASTDLYFDPSTRKFYYLTSGRWFSASSPQGPWAYATADLPADFAFIDPQGQHAHVLPSVPNTAQAQAAVLQAEMPQQGTLKRSGTTVKVTYAGAPEFVPIPGTSIKYATNTSYQVLEVQGRYYCCYQAAWFVSAAPTGPWVLAESVPQAVYTIPPTSPVYPVTYVTVQSYNPASVTYAYTAGYLLGFVTAGLLVYGTGYYYPPYVYPGRVPVYYPRPYTYAGRVYYNGATGTWARGAAVYTPYGGARYGAAYNPATGAYARGGSVWGPYGGAGAFSAYNPSTGSYARGSASWNAYGGTMNASAYNARTGVSASTTQNTNYYQRWGSSTINTPTQTVNTASASGPRGSAGAFSSTTGAQGAAYNTRRGQGAAVQTSSGDVYAGRDGNAYKHTSDGWSTWNNGSWQQVQKPTTATTAQPQARTMDRSTYQQLETDRQARTGTFRAGGLEGGAARERFRR